MTGASDGSAAMPNDWIAPPSLVGTVPMLKDFTGPAIFQTGHASTSPPLSTGRSVTDSMPSLRLSGRNGERRNGNPLPKPQLWERTSSGLNHGS